MTPLAAEIARRVNEDVPVEASPDTIAAFLRRHFPDMTVDDLMGADRILIEIQRDQIEEAKRVLG